VTTSKPETQLKTIWKSNPLIVSSVAANLDYHSIVVDFELEGVRTLRSIRSESSIVHADIKLELVQSSELEYIHNAIQTGKRMRLTLEFED
jgi:hypothetical protein